MDAIMGRRDCEVATWVYTWVGMTMIEKPSRV